MAFRKQKQMLEKYNTLFENNELRLRVLEWNVQILLNNKVSLKTKTEKRKFRTRASSQLLLSSFDTIYNTTDNDQRDEIVKSIQKQNASMQNKQYWNNLDENTKEQKREHMRKIRHLVNYDTKPYVRPWNKGKTKETDIRLKEISKQRSGQGNPMFGTIMSKEEKQRKSILIKERIKTGEWTPHIHNSRTHWECSYEGKQYRSSWEAIYASLNPNDEYELIRISYSYENKERIYIVDFVNRQTCTLTEIKPQEHITSAQTKVKFKAAEEWCRKNNYIFRVLTQDYFIENYDKIPFEQLTIPNILTKLRRLKYEAKTKS